MTNLIRFILRSALVLFVIIVVIGSLSKGGSPPKDHPSSPALEIAPVESPHVDEESSTVQTISKDHSKPLDEERFINGVKAGMYAFNAGRNDMQKGAARPLRASNLCKALKSNRALSWVGTVKTLSSNSDGKGVLSVQVADNITVQTWNNSVSDFADHTLIEPDDPVLASASALHEGQTVIFSGDLIRGRSDCFKESSMTLEGSMLDPEFIMRFRDIGPAD